MIALLSIKPEFVDMIFSGEKSFEFRKACFKKKVGKVIIYCTMPVGKIVGEFGIDKILEGRPDEIWEETKNAAGIDKMFYDTYFDSRSISYAIKIKSAMRYRAPIDPKIIFRSFTPPQSFCYIESIKSKLISGFTT